MSAKPVLRLTAAEYLEIERMATYKSEFHDGEMFAMAGASREHNGIKDNLIVEIGSRLRGGKCRTFSSDQRVKVDATGLYTYPDIVLLCGPGEYDPLDRDTLVNPTAILEVLSPNTEAYDRGARFRQFREVASLQEYVLVSQHEPIIERFTRQPDGTWSLTTFAGMNAVFDLTCAAVSIPLSEIYRDVEGFDEPSSTS